MTIKPRVEERIQQIRNFKFYNFKEPEVGYSWFMFPTCFFCWEIFQTVKIQNEIRRVWNVKLKIYKKENVSAGGQFDKRQQIKPFVLLHWTRVGYNNNFRV